MEGPELKNGIVIQVASNSQAWRTWLEQNHLQAQSVWLRIFKKESQIPSVYYDEAVNEALCFGWIDSKPNTYDEQSYVVFFSKRNPKSNWSAVNKQKVTLLEAQGKLAPEGLRMIALAKQTGTWDALNQVELLQIPPDLETAFYQYPKSKEYFEAFPKSTRKGILEWINNAKQAETRAKRIDETARLASQNIRANQYRPK